MERTKAILVRVTAEEHQQIRELAATAGMSMGSYLRTLALDQDSIALALSRIPASPLSIAKQTTAGTKVEPHPAASGLGVAKRIRDDKGNRL